MIRAVFPGQRKGLSSVRRGIEPALFSGRLTVFSFENTVEIGKVVKTAFLGNLQNRGV